MEFYVLLNATIVRYTHTSDPVKSGGRFDHTNCPYIVVSLAKRDATVLRRMHSVV